MENYDTRLVEIRARFEAAQQSVAWTQNEDWTPEQRSLHKRSVADVAVLLKYIEGFQKHLGEQLLEIYYLGFAEGLDSTLDTLEEEVGEVYND